MEENKRSKNRSSSSRNKNQKSIEWKKNPGFQYRKKKNPKNLNTLMSNSNDQEDLAFPILQPSLSVNKRIEFKDLFPSSPKENFELNFSNLTEKNLHSKALEIAGHLKSSRAKANGFFRNLITSFLNGDIKQVSIISNLLIELKESNITFNIIEEFKSMNMSKPNKLLSILI